MPARPPPKVARPPRPQEQVNALAAEFRSAWVPADGIEPWLRRHIVWLESRVLQGGWTWADVGRALTAAGITYGTARPWTGPMLGSKMVKVRASLKKRAGTKPARQPLPDAPPPPATAKRPPAVLPMPPQPEAEPDKPTFALASFAKPQRPALPTVTQKPPSAEAPAIDVDAVIRKMRGESE